MVSSGGTGAKESGLGVLLFIENSSERGGSFQSLKEILSALSDRTERQHVAFRYYSDEDLRGSAVENPIFIDDERGRISRMVGRGAAKLYASLPIPGCVLASMVTDRSLITEYRKVIRRLQPDLVVCNTFPTRDRHAIFAAELEGATVVAHLRMIAERSGFPGRGLTAFFNDAVAMFVANSNVVRDSWIRRGLEPDKIMVVPNTVGPLPDHRPHATLDALRRERKRIVGCVGRIVSKKGQDLLARAFGEHLARRREDLHLVFVGDGAERSALEDLLRSLGIESRATLLGRDPDASSLMHYFDTLVVPAVDEAFGRVAIEGMAAGVPVVALASAGLEEVVIDGHDGILVPEGAPGALAEAVARVLDEPELAEHLATNGLESVRSRFSRAAHKKGIESAYRCARRSPRTPHPLPGSR